MKYSCLSYLMKSLVYILATCLPIIYSCHQPVKSYTIHTIGDSTMADKKPEVYPETGWCQVFPELLPAHIRLVNHAVNGRSTKSFIDEGRWKVVLDQLKPGDYVFIQFGHNDQKIQDSTRYADARGAYRANMERFIAETRENGATPILFTSIVRRKFDENGKLIPTHGEYPEVVRAVALESEVMMVDLEFLTARLVEETGMEESKSVYLWTEPDDRFPEGRQDDTHLSVEGARLVARLAHNELKQIFR